MVSQETQNLVLSIVDYNQEYHTKLIILFLVLAYSVIMYWYSGRLLTVQERLKTKDRFLFIVMRVWSLPYIVLFVPLLTIMSFRGYSLMNLFNLILGFYVVVIIIIFIYVFLFGWDKLLGMFGFDKYDNSNKMAMNNKMSKIRRRL